MPTEINIMEEIINQLQEINETVSILRRRL